MMLRHVMLALARYAAGFAAAYDARRHMLERCRWLLLRSLLFYAMFVTLYVYFFLTPATPRLRF